MSALPRLARNRSPRHSTSRSPRRRPLHERSDSDTNELAGVASQRSSKTDLDFAYTQSPFPRLPSQVLRPAGSAPLVYEDSTATPPLPSPSPSHARTAKWPPPDDARPSRSRLPRPEAAARPKGKGRARVDPLDLPPPPHPSTSEPSPGRRSPRLPERSNSKVRTIVSAIEEASLRSESLPPTPRPSSRPRLSTRASQAPHAFPDEPWTPTSDPRSGIETDESMVVQSPVLDPEEPFTALPSSTGFSNEPLSDVPEASIPSSPPVSHMAARPVELPGLRRFHVMRSNESLQPDMIERPRSSSAPMGPTEDLLQALIASGTNIQYPRLEKPSVASFDTDSSSLRRALPQPLQLRRKQGRSHLAESEPRHDFVLEYDERSQPSQVDAAPSTPPRNLASDSSLHSHWTPGRWTAELEDTVPELNPHALRTQHSFYGDRDSQDSRPASACSNQSASSSIGFYRFLNDSKTAWAKSYYGGHGALRNVTPPHLSVASLSRSSTSGRLRSYSESLSFISQPASQSVSQSQESSDGLPDAIYIPRRRPFQRRPVNAPIYGEVSSPVDLGCGEQVHDQRDARRFDRLSDAPSEPRLPEIVEYAGSPGRSRGPLRRQHQQHAPPLTWTHPNDVFGPVPHLSPDRSADPRYSVTRPPSLDGYGWFTPANVQLGLAILGLLCPFCWMIGACLRLPPKPAFPAVDPETGRADLSPETQQAFLENPDVKQYHKARFLRRVNRAMSITGICIVAAVIAIAIVATR